MCMITPDHSELAYSLAKHYFDETTALVIKTLFNYDQASIKLLKFSLPNIKFSDLKKSLLILVKYQLADYVKCVKNFSQQYEYSVVPNRVFAFFRISKYIQKFSQRRGPLAGLLLSTLAEKGLMSKEKLLALTLKKLNQKQDLFGEVSQVQVGDNIEELLAQGYLVQTKDICFKIERFHRDYRDNLIADTIYHYYCEEKKIKPLCETILDLTRENTADEATLTSPIPLMDIVKKLVPSTFETKGQLEYYLLKLTKEENNRFIVTCGNHQNKGLMYAINTGLVIDYLVKEHLSSIITTRFGPKCCRVFRVLVQRGPLLLKQIEEIIMLPARDVREYCYMLIKEGFIRNRQVPKTPDNAPGKSVFIMSVELDFVVYNATDLCCRSMNNLLIRYKFELEQNKNLLDRSKAVQELLGLESYPSNDKVDNLEDWNQYFSGHELDQLKNINRTLDRISLARAQVDETLFLFHTWTTIRQNLEVDETG